MAGTALALQCVESKLAKPLDALNIKKGIVLVTEESWASIKMRLKGIEMPARSLAVTPQTVSVLPVRDWKQSLDLNYPEIGRESNALLLRRRLWAKAYPVEQKHVEI